MIINNEECFPFKYNENYYLSKTGKVYSIYVPSGCGKIDINNPHLLSYGQDRDGYYRVVLSLNGNKRYVKVHTLMVEQFIGDIPSGMVVNHKDGNIHNNCIENLEIVTPEYNTMHAHVMGLIPKDIRIDVVYDNYLYRFYCMEQCMRTFPDLTKDYIDRIRNGIIEYSMVLFVKMEDNNKTYIYSYYNGMFYKKFDTMQDVDKYFNMARGTTSGAIKCNQYRSRVNKYTIIFPNVSTIENYHGLIYIDDPEISRVHF